MPGRKNPRETGSEAKREYRLHEKIEAGEKLVGDEGASLDMRGGAGRVRRQRQTRYDMEE